MTNSPRGKEEKVEGLLCKDDTFNPHISVTDVGLLHATDLLRSSLPFPDSRVDFQCPFDLYFVLGKKRGQGSLASQRVPEIPNTANVEPGDVTELFLLGDASILWEATSGNISGNIL